MNQNNERNSRKRLNSLILLVAFTAVMLIVSTYAWFSTQKNVTIGGLYGKVNVAEGLQISLDAKTWSNSIELGTAGGWTIDTDEETGVTTWTNDTYVPGATFQQPYITGQTGSGENIEDTYANNVTPGELLPVSTTGGTGDGIGDDHVHMYWGNLEEGIQLNTVKKMTEEPKSGYFAFDVFVQNSSSTNAPDKLQLEPKSSVTVDTGKDTTGLQNSVRVGFALYENSNDTKVTVNNTPSTDEIIAGAAVGKKIKDVAIWEPNSDYHVTDIVNSNNKVTWSAADLNLYGFDAEGDASANAHAKFSSTPNTGVAKFHTYALSSDSIVPINDAGGKTPTTEGWTPTYDNTIENIYDWATPAQGLKKQVTLQTSAVYDESNNYTVGSDGMAETAKLDLISIKNTELLNDKKEDGSLNTDNDPKYDDDGKDDTPMVNDTRFTLTGGQYHKMRIYVWLEGQDVDCTNFASLGSGLTLDIGFSKPGTITAE